MSPASPKVNPLQRIALGDISPDEALDELVKVLHSDKENGAAAVYEAARAATWKIISSRSGSGSARDWYDVLRQLSSHLSSGFKPEWAPRVRTLAELVVETVRFSEVNSASQLLQRDHVRKILTAMNALQVDGRVRRQELSRRVKLGDSNLSRILASMITVGLISREFEGREAIFMLTPEGRNPGRPRPAEDETVITDPPIVMDMSAVS